MPRVKEVEFGFENYDRHSRSPEAENPHLADWLKSNERASHSEPSNEDLGIVPDRRPLVAYFLIVLALGMYVGWAFLAGWL